MRAIKILLAIVAAIAVLVVVAALALVTLVDPNDYKGYVTTWVEERTGRPFAIEGDLDLAFFPWLAIETERVALGQPPGFDAAESFATVERISAGVRLLPLLERRFEIGSVRIDGLRLDLRRGPDGRGNWEDFGDASAPNAQDAAPAEALVDNLDIERIEIRDGEVRWYEEGTQPRYVASGIRIETGRIRAGEPIDASLAVRIEDAETQRGFDVEARSLVGLRALRAAADDGAVTLRDFALRLRASDPAQREIAAGSLDAERLNAAADGSVEIGAAHLDARLAATDAAPSGLDFGADWSAARFDPRAGEFAAEDLVTRVAGVSAAWQLAARNVIDAPQIEGSVRIVDAPLGAALETFGIAMPASLASSTPGPGDSAARNDDGSTGGPGDDGRPRTVSSALDDVDASAEFSAALSVIAPGPAGGGQDAGSPSESSALVFGPYRLDALRLDALALELAGTAFRGDAALGEDGVLRANLDLPEQAPSEALRALAAAYAPDGLDLAAIERIALSGRIELGLADGRIGVQDLRAALLGAELVGELDAAPAANGTGRVLRGTLRTTPIEPERLARLLGELMPAAISPDELGPLTVDTRFEYDTAARRLALDDVSLGVFGLAAAGRAVLTGFGGELGASGEARVAPFSPRALMQRFGQPVPETSDPSALQRVSLTARFDAGADGGRFTNIDLALDDTRITGEYAIDGLANPAHRFALAIDRVDVDRYLPPQASDLPDEADEDARTAGDIELPAEALRTLRIDGSVSVGALRLAGLDFRDVATRIEVGDGRASLDSARARLYGGEFAGSLHVDTTNPDAPGLRLAGRASSLELAPLITALTGDANVSGTGDFELDLTGSGATVLENVETASGDVTFSMRDGAIEGFNLGRALCAVYNTARRLPAPAAQPSRTEYVSIGGTATVTDGVAASRDLLARTSFMDLTGAGNLALAEQRLDYTLEATLTGSTGIPGCEAMDGLIGESLPLTLQGRVTDPQIRPDFSEIIQRQLRDAVRDRLQDRLRDLLR